jgi:hypothetical protein
MRLAVFKKLAKVGFFFIWDPIRSCFGTFVRGKLVIIETVLTAMESGRAIGAKIVASKWGSCSNFAMTLIAPKHPMTPVWIIP